MHTIQWHPKFLKFELDNSGVLLVGEVLSYYFSYGNYPGLELIDTQCSPEQSLIQQGNFHQLSYFNHYSNQLAKQGVTLDGKTATSLAEKYCQTKLTHPVTLVKQKQLKIVNLSAAQPSYLDAWTTLLQSEKLTQRVANLGNSVTLILLDDFTHQAIDDAIAHSDCWMLIKITGERIWISPLVDNTPGHSVNWPLIKQRIKNNQPERQLVAQLFPQRPIQVPFLQLPELATRLKALLLPLLINQLQSDCIDLCVLTCQNGQVSYHPFKQIRTFNDSDVAQQIQRPVKLTSQVVQFDQDGGSRCATPAHTLETLQPLISPITGIINHFYQLEPKTDKSLEIYCSRFSRTPIKRQLKNLSLADFSMTCAGKGVSSTQSKVSALCEAIERYAPVFQGNEPKFLSSRSNLNGPSYSPHDLTPYSEQQYQSFMQPGSSFYQTKYAKKRYQQQKIHWISAWSLNSQKAVYVPFACCFSNTPFSDEDYCLWHSNGCAAGNNSEEAILQGLFELIERDAVGIWWYNKVPRPGYDLTQLSEQLLTQVKQTLPDDMEFWVLDVTNDNQVPVMVAVAQNKISKGFTIGLGCHLNPVLAAQRALTELCQLYPNRNTNKALFDFDKIPDEPFMYPNEQACAIENTLEYSKDISHNIMAIVEQLAVLGLDTLVVDYSRNDLPIKAVKVFAPGLCHIWPQLGNERLYQVPMKLGWLEKAKTENSVNQQGLYI